MSRIDARNSRKVFYQIVPSYDNDIELVAGQREGSIVSTLTAFSI